VEADAADFGREVDDDVAAVERRAGLRGVAQVVLGGSDDARLGAERLEVADDRPAEEPGAAGHDGGPARPEPRLRLGRAHDRRTPRPASWSSRSLTSASIMIRASSSNVTVGAQPSFSRALLASPHRASTSAGR